MTRQHIPPDPGPPEWDDAPELFEAQAADYAAEFGNVIELQPAGPPAQNEEGPTPASVEPSETTGAAMNPRRDYHDSRGSDEQARHRFRKRLADPNQPPPEVHSVELMGADSIAGILTPEFQLLAHQIEADVGIAPGPASLLMLGVLSATLAPWWFVQAKGTHKEPLVIWPAWVAPSGAGKSPIHGQITAPLIELQMELAKSAKTSHRSWEADRQAMKERGDPADELAAHDEKEPLRIAPPISNATAAALFRDLRGGPTVFVSDEGDELFRSATNAAGGNGDSAVSDVLKAYGRTPVSRTRASEHEAQVIEHPCFSIIIAAQPTTLAGLSEELFDRGLVPRLSVIATGYSGTGLAVSPPRWRERWGSEVWALWHATRSPNWEPGKSLPSWSEMSKLTLTRGALDLRSRIEEMVTAGRPDAARLGFSAQWGKLPGRALRYGGLFTLLRREPSGAYPDADAIDERALLAGIEAAMGDFRLTRDALLGREARVLAGRQDAEVYRTFVLSLASRGLVKAGDTLSKHRSFLPRALRDNKRRFYPAQDELVRCKFLVRDDRGTIRVGDLTAQIDGPDDDGDDGIPSPEERAAREVELTRAAGLAPDMTEIAERYRVDAGVLAGGEGAR